MGSRLLKKSICCVLGAAEILTYLPGTLRSRRCLRPCIWNFLTSLRPRLVFQRPVRRQFLALVVLAAVLLGGPGLRAGGGEPDAAPATEPVTTPPAPAGLLKALETRRTELDRREAQLAQREQRLQTLEREITQKLDRIVALRKEADRTAGNTAPDATQKIERLVKIYEKMALPEAVGRLQRLDEALALELLSRMKEKTAAKILGGMPTDKAARLSERLVRPRRARTGVKAAENAAPTATVAPN